MKTINVVYSECSPGNKGLWCTCRIPPGHFRSLPSTGTCSWGGETHLWGPPATEVHPPSLPPFGGPRAALQQEESGSTGLAFPKSAVPREEEASRSYCPPPPPARVWEGVLAGIKPFLPTSQYKYLTLSLRVPLTPCLGPSLHRPAPSYWNLRSSSAFRGDQTKKLEFFPVSPRGNQVMKRSPGARGLTFE